MTRPTQLDTTYVNRSVELPYGLQVSEVEKGVAETYRLFHGIKTVIYNAILPLEGDVFASYVDQ